MRTRSKELKLGLTITLDMTVIQATKLLAEKDGRPLSRYINRVLKDHIKTKELE